MTDIGNLALLLVTVLTAFATVASAVGARLGRMRLIRAGERALVAAWALCGLAMAALWTLLMRNDFRVEYVWGHSNRDLPIFYKVTALWSGQEGSLVLWTFVLLTYGALCVALYRHRDRELMPWVVAVIAASAFFFSLLNVFVANAFQEIALVLADGSIAELPTAPPDGRGLNPLLQHPAMGIHPPILYAGYIGFIVPFAFCLAALITGRLGDGWIRSTRRWTLAAWLLQGCGILLGAWWAYEELGWGGYWAWDPVENASLMPWLVATAFLHSIQIQEKRGMLKVWNVALILLTYGLAIFGTFTTRSGIMSSVHAFAESSIGGWFVGYLLVVIAVTAWFLAKRLDGLESENRFEAMVSRESAFLFNNLILMAACFAVFWGTMFPVLSEAITGEKIVVGAPFFNRVEIPLALVLLLLTGVGPLLAWRKSSARTLWKNFAIPTAFGLVTAGVMVASGMRHYAALMSFGLCAFVLVTILTEFHRGGRARARSIGSGYLGGMIDLVRRNKRRYGGYFVHFAFVVMFVGFTGKAFDTETKVSVEIGDTVRLRGYELKVVNLVEGDVTNPNYERSSMTLAVTRGGESVTTLVPESRFYHASQQVTTEVARWGSLREDVYTVFVRAGADQPPELQVFVNPLVSWVWIGGVLMALGSLLTMIPDHRPSRRSPTSAGAVAAEQPEKAHV